MIVVTVGFSFPFLVQQTTHWLIAHSPAPLVSPELSDYVESVRDKAGVLGQQAVSAGHVVAHWVTDHGGQLVESLHNLIVDGLSRAREVGGAAGDAFEGFRNAV